MPGNGLNNNRNNIQQIMRYFMILKNSMVIHMFEL